MTHLILLAVGVASYHDIDPDLFTRLVYAESRFDPQAVSESGCVGLGQLNLAAWPLDEWAWPTDDPFDPLPNLWQSAHILSWLLSRYDDTHEAVVAYTLGHGTVDELIAIGGDWFWWWDDLPEAVREYGDFIIDADPGTRWGTFDWRDAVRAELREAR